MRPPPFFEHRQHRVADEIGVALRIVFVFGRDGVRAEEGDGEIERGLVVEGEQGFEETQLGGGLQTVTGFGFGGGGAVDEHAQETRATLRDERLHAGGAGLLDRGKDAAARRENIEIGHARHLQLEFVGAVARPNEMRVRIDKAGHEHAAARIEGRFVGIGGFEFSRGADRDDRFIADNDRAVFDDAERAEGVSALGTAFEGEKLGGGVDEHGRFQRVESG